MAEPSDLIFAYLQDETGAWQSADWATVESWQPADGLLWVHLVRTSERTANYLRETAGINRLVCDALLAEESRPRSTSFGEGLLINLRGVNLNPGADGKDLVSLRMWAEPSRLITTRLHTTLAVADLRERLDGGARIADIGTLVTTLAASLVNRFSGVLESLDEQEDDVEASMLGEETVDLRGTLAGIRRQAILLRRYLAPQREALARMARESDGVLDEAHRARVLEVQDRVTRYVEDLDAIRERAAIIQDELMSRLSDRLNRNMYLLTLISSVMLPLGFLTGLLGINVDGMPGASDSPFAFAGVTIGLVALAGLEIALLRRLRWL